MFFTKRIFIAVFIILVHIPLNGYGQGEFVADDKIYNKNIKTALLYPVTPNTINVQLNPPIIPLSQNYPLILEFDELGSEYQNYYAKIIYCNADWTISTINSIQYMNDYNEFFINNRLGSIGTRIPYIHYTFTLPKVNYSGNYIIKVYKDYNEDDLIITRRFSVYENAIQIMPTVKFSTDPSARNTHEQIDFNISYTGVDIINPLQNLKVVLRKNFRWDQTITDLKPTVPNETNKFLEYYYYNRENNFEGGNEYRRIEIQSVMYNGFNVMKVRRDTSKAEAWVYPEKSRAGEAYSQPLFADFDGRYYIMNKESGDNQLAPEYMYVNFSFLSAQPVQGKVYVFGALTNWQADKNFEMVYNSDKKEYSCQVLLKQGVYDFNLALVNPKTGKIDETYFEGSHSITQNNYDILVYYRPFGSRNDFLLGYKSVNYLPRR